MPKMRGKSSCGVYQLHEMWGTIFCGETLPLLPDGNFCLGHYMP